MSKKLFGMIAVVIISAMVLAACAPAAATASPGCTRGD